jgi:hypothetical protein
MWLVTDGLVFPCIISLDGERSTGRSRSLGGFWGTIEGGAVTPGCCGKSTSEASLVLTARTILRPLTLLGKLLGYSTIAAGAVILGCCGKFTPETSAARRLISEFVAKSCGMRETLRTVIPVTPVRRALTTSLLSHWTILRLCMYSTGCSGNCI